jgi:hypothetical protein
MLIDLLLKLVDRLIDLAKRHEEVNRTLFVNFIQPAFQTFEIVHADYIDSLVRYSSRLADRTLAMDLNHPVFADIELDALKTDHLRIKLKDFKPKESSPEIQGLLTAIDFYLRGVSASADHADLIAKLAGGALRSFGPNDIKSLVLSKASIEVHPIEVHPFAPTFLVSDPWRLALRQVFVGFDAPKPENDEEDRELLTQGTVNLCFISDEQRRELCLNAVRDAMGHFQALYGVVSSAYSKLRSELMTAG